jgi:hypothetical protein
MMMRKFLCCVAALCLFRGATLAAVECPELLNPTTSVALKDLTEHMRGSLIQYCGGAPIAEIRKFGQGNASVYKVDLADRRTFVLKDSRKGEIANNIAVLGIIGGRGGQPLCLQGETEPWGTIVTITHCFLNGRWYEINDPEIPSLLEGCIDFSYTMHGLRNGTPIPTIQPFFPGVGRLDALSEGRRMKAAACLAQAVVFITRLDIRLSDLHRVTIFTALMDKSLS